MSTSTRDVDYESISLRSKRKVKRLQKITIRIIIEKVVSMKIRNSFDRFKSMQILSFTR